MEIRDPTNMYVAESWVGKGQWLGKEIDYKGRGRMGVIKHPKASKSALHIKLYITPPQQC